MSYLATELKIGTLVLSGIVLVGCATLQPESNLLGGGRVTTASANQLFYPNFEGFDDESLVRLLDPEDKREKPDWKGEYDLLSKSDRFRQLRAAFRAANEKYKLGLRSQIQDRLIAASNQRCNLYATYLKRVSTYTNGLFGTLTTVLGGAGAIVTGADAARLLSGLAGISSGTRAELNQAIFESVATSVIVPSIKQTRKEILDEILAKRSKTLDEYTVEGAIADAIRYHGACSIDAGIEHAQKSIQSFEDIGVKRFVELQAKLADGRSISQGIALGPVASVQTAKKALSVFKTQLESLTLTVEKLGTGEAEKKVAKRHKELLLQAGNELEPKATELDKNLAEILVAVTSTTGADKAAASTRLAAQQEDARDFQKRLNAIFTQFELELKAVK